MNTPNRTSNNENLGLISDNKISHGNIRLEKNANIFREDDREARLIGTSLKHSNIKDKIEKVSSVLEDVSPDGAESENCEVIKKVKSDVITNETVQKTDKGKHNESSELKGKEKQRLQQQNKTHSIVAAYNHDLSANQKSPEPPLVDRTGDQSTNFSDSSVKPKIFAGPGEIVSDLNPWVTESIFDQLKFRIMPLTTASDRLEYCQLLDKFRKLRSAPETSYFDGDSYVNDRRASFRKVSHEAFTLSRLATLRKTPASIVLPKCTPDPELEKESFSSRNSLLDLTVGLVRLDEVQLASPRFDPYHSDCGPDCRKCFFLTQTQNPPHLAPKMMKLGRSVDTTVSSKSQRKKFGFGIPVPKSKES